MSNITSIIKKTIEKNNPEQSWVVDNLLFLHVGGSRLYETNTVDSDWDIRGVTLPPKDYWVGAKRYEQTEFKVDNYDVVIYDIRKWLNLAIAINPNVIETLFVNNENTIVTTIAWDQLIKPRVKPLLNQRAYVAYHGYATSQLKKMMVKQSNKTGRQYITEEYGFDLKFASHGFRLISQGVEILTTGNITFPRPDRNLLMDIRNGKVYGINEMDRCVAEWEERSKELDEALKNTVLPKKADFDEYNALLINIYDELVSPCSS